MELTSQITSSSLNRTHSGPELYHISDSTIQITKSQAHNSVMQWEWDQHKLTLGRKMKRLMPMITDPRRVEHLANA